MRGFMPPIPGGPVESTEQKIRYISRHTEDFSYLRMNKKNLKKYSGFRLSGETRSEKFSDTKKVTKRIKVQIDERWT